MSQWTKISSYFISLVGPSCQFNHGDHIVQNHKFNPLSVAGVAGCQKRRHIDTEIDRNSTKLIVEPISGHTYISYQHATSSSYILLLYIQSQTKKPSPYRETRARWRQSVDNLVELIRKQSDEIPTLSKRNTACGVFISSFIYVGCFRICLDHIPGNISWNGAWHLQR